jgi:LmbE family N-acetylglucosaminyl deacetylase
MLALPSLSKHDAFERVLCIAAHPDDEVLGAGATLAGLVDRGHEVHVLVLGEGVGGRFAKNVRPDHEVRQLASEFEKAASIIGATPHQLSLPDNRFDTIDLIDVIQLVETLKREVEPTLVFTHHHGDLNVDHRVTAEAVLTAFRPLPNEIRTTLLGFETISSTEWNVHSHGTVFAPNWFEDASIGLERKVEALAAYQHELRDWPHPRSLEGVRVAARRWGMVVGLEAAEAFVLLRRVSPGW